MKIKLLTGLIVAISLAVTAFAQQSSSGSTELPTGDLLPQTTLSLLEGGSYLGVYAENINRENMAHYNLSRPQGVGITQVEKNSPAEKAGLRKDDVILRVDSETVTSVRKLNRLVSEVAPDQTVKVSISRNGSEQEVSATVGKRENSFARLEELGNRGPKVWKWSTPGGNGDDNFVFSFANGRRIGVSTMELTKQLADYFGITGGKGVLVTSVTDDGPAARAGVKAGDVITAVDGEQIETTGDISRAINSKKDGDVTLTIIRNRVQQTIRVTPKEGTTLPPTVTSPQVGRRIVIPRVEFPEFPGAEISIPRITIPAIPAINIDLPRVVVKPAVMKVKTRPI